MKIRRLALLLALVLLLGGLCITAQAASEDEAPLVKDAAGILTQEEDDALNELAEQLSQRYCCEIIVITVRELGDWNVEDLAEAAYLAYDYGYGDERSGVMLLLSMAERDYDMVAYGYGNVAFTDFGKQHLMERVLPSLGKDDWYGGLSTFIRLCGDYLAEAEKGTPVDVNHVPRQPMSAGKVTLALVIGALAALLTTSIMAGRMKSAVLQTRADAYMEQLELRRSEDQFLRSERTRVRRESGGSSGGGGGTTVRSSGFSHSSGKF